MMALFMSTVFGDCMALQRRVTVSLMSGRVAIAAYNRLPVIDMYKLAVLWSQSITFSG